MLGLPVSNDQCENCSEGEAKRINFNPAVKNAKQINTFNSINSRNV